MNILTISSLYPNTEQPRHGIFIETRMKLFHQQYPECNVTVIAPIPWFPLRNTPPAGTGDYRRIPCQQQRGDINVYYPRYLAIPGAGMYSNPVMMFFALLGQVNALRKQGLSFDIIDAHYFYPDVIAANWLGRYLKLPVVATARGSDINIWPGMRWPRRLITKALNAVTVPVAVSQALADKMAKLSAPARDVTCIPNGVDTSMFYPATDTAASNATGVKRGLRVLSVGNLVALKGHDLVIDAIATQPDISLTIIGEGPLHDQLQAQVQQLQLTDRVRFMPNQPQEELRQHYTDADCLVLASSNEGWPNVLLEAMACGCPVVVTPFASAHEVVQSDKAGIIATARSPQAISDALSQLLKQKPSAQEVIAYAANFSWQHSLTKLKQVFDQAIVLYSATRNTGATHAR